MSYINTHEQIHSVQAHKDSLFYSVLSAVALFILAPVIIYFYHVISYGALRVLGALVLFAFISNIIYKLIAYFFENYDAQNSIHQYK